MKKFLSNLMLLASCFAFGQIPGSPSLTRTQGNQLLGRLISQRPPEVTDDATAGYVVGSNWLNNATGDLYECVDNTSGGACWQKVSYQPQAAMFDNIGSSNLQALYGMVKLPNAYGGYALRIQRASDGTTLDVGFVAANSAIPNMPGLQVVDVQAMDAFLQGTTGTVIIWYDQSGNGYNATASYSFTVSSMNATIGATYTNNSATFTVLATIASGTTIICSGTGEPSPSGTLTKATGTGDPTGTFSASVSTAPPVCFNKINGIRTLSFPYSRTAGNGGPYTLAIPAGVSANHNACSIVMAGNVKGGPGIAAELGSSSSNNISLYSDNSLLAGNIYGNLVLSTVHEFTNTSNFRALTIGTSTYIATSNERSVSTATGPNSNTATGGTIGGSLAFGNSLAYDPQFVELAIYARQLTTTEVSTLKTYTYRLLSVTPQYDCQILMVGDSITGGVGPQDAMARDLYLEPLLTRPAAIVNYGVPGITAASVATNLASGAFAASTFAQSGLKKQIARVMIGINDCSAGATGATIYSYIVTICGLLSTAGFTVIIEPILPSNNITTGQNAQRLACNTLIASNWPSFASAYINLLTNAEVANAASTTNYTDGLHPTSYLSSILSMLEAPTINALLGRPQFALLDRFDQYGLLAKHLYSFAL